MVIRTKMMSRRYAMASSDCFQAGFEIWFGSLNFQATRNDYLMRLTNRDELYPWQSTGPSPIPDTSASDAPALAAAAVAASTSRCRRRSGQRSCQAGIERHRAAHAAARRDAPPPTDMMAPPVVEHAAAGPQFPHGMRNSAATYASSISTDVAAYEDLPGNGTQFTGKKVLEFCDGYHIRVNWVTAAHPQTNDQVEHANDIILQGLKPRIFDKLNKFGRKWIQELPSAIWSLRTTLSRATGFTPFFLVYGAEGRHVQGPPGSGPTRKA
jgi:hypothetical protein